VLDRAGNRRRPQDAAVDPAARWRDQQQSRVVVTDRRLHCVVHAKGWVSFDHATATALRAVPERCGVVLEYPGTAPLCLSGPAITEIMVVVVWALYGADGLRQHPALAEVMSGLPAATRLEPPPAPPAALSRTGATVDGSDAVDGPAAAPPPVSLLEFVAAHELVLAAHVAGLMGVSESDATERLDELVEQDLASRVRLSAHSPAAYRITQSGAHRVDPALPPLGPMDLTGYRRAVSLPGLWLAARAGSFGKTRDVLTTRQMQAADAASRTEALVGVAGARFGDDSVRGGKVGIGYPDLGLLSPTRGWATADLVLAVPDRERLHSLLGRAHHDERIVQQRFVVEDEPAAELVETTAEQLGLANQVDVQLIDAVGIVGG
jgi:hypothetical protein